MAAKQSTHVTLTHTFVKNIGQPGRYSDGPGSFGLTLLVKTTSDGRLSKTWSHRVRIHGKLHYPGLGKWPAVTLAEARKRALNNARMVEEGHDIFKPAPTVPTVDQVFDIVIEQRRPSWKAKDTEGHWRLSKQYCHAIIGSKPVSEVKQEDVIDVLGPIWQKKPKTAREIRSNLSTVMQWAINREYRASNPAAPGIVQELGKQPSSGHHSSLPFNAVGSALALIRDADTWWAVRYCLIFAAFTGVRSGEARMATWDEIDWENLTWNISPERMKNSIGHRVPLSSQVIDILYYARDQKGCCEGLIFPSERGARYIQRERLSNLMRKLGIPAPPHGFRASFRNWAGARANYIPGPVAEMVLAHKQGEKIQQVYMTSDFFEQRVPVMDEWADYLTATMGPMIQVEQNTE